jgi:hypothetical protein
MNKLDQESTNVAPASVTNEELKTLLEANLKLLQETHDMTHKIKSYVSFQKFMSFVYMFLIIAPIVLSIIYLPPILNQVFGEYRSLLDLSSPSSILKNLNTQTQIK